MSSSMTTTPSAKRALVHLKKIKPYEGWSIETTATTGQVRLLRRSVALTDNYFYDIHYDTTSGSVVGILTRAKPCRAQVLVDDRGKPVSTKTPTIMYVTTWSPIGATSSRTRPRSTTGTTTTSAGSSDSSFLGGEGLSDEQNQQLIQYAVYAVGIAVAVRVVLSAMFSFYILALPLVFFYALQTCPSEGSFDAKKELKRVMRGHHLPEDHPDKPRGWLNETIAKVSASVTTELATGLGYELSMTNFANACMIANVNVPSVNRGYLWIGIFGKWRFVYSSELERAQAAS